MPTFYEFFAGGGMASVFAVFHGTGNGILTIARGTMPLATATLSSFGPCLRLFIAFCTTI